MAIQEVTALDKFYEVEDPWRYESTQDDSIRIARLLAALPKRTFGRVLDIGCGNGFLTVRLPGLEVVGCDISPRAIEWSRMRAARCDASHVSFRVCSIFNLDAHDLGRFDLIVITGVLYPQYIGRGFSLIQLKIDSLLDDGGLLASVHIDDWCPWRFPYALLHADISPYRQYIHRLELFEK